MKNWQFNQYIESYRHKERLIAEIDAQIAELYDDISPTITTFDVTRIGSSSVPIDVYVFDLIEQKTPLEYRKNRIEQQHETVVKMLENISASDKEYFHRSTYFDSRERRYFKKLLDQFVDDEHKTSYTGDMTVYDDDLLSLPVDEYDEAVEEMRDEELFKYYFDKSDTWDAQIAMRNMYIDEIRNVRGRKSSQREVITAV